MNTLKVLTILGISVVLIILFSTICSWLEYHERIYIFQKVSLSTLYGVIRTFSNGTSSAGNLSMSTTMFKDKKPIKEFVISFYTPFFGTRPWEVFLPKDNYTQECGYEFSGCSLHYNVSNWKNADILFFHGRDMPSVNELQELKKQAKKGQLWVYFIHENPFNTPSISPLAHLFELTSSYRLKSDFFLSYGFYDELSDDELFLASKHERNYAKTKQIAWMVSHCSTLRDKLAFKFQEVGLQIDVGGNCASRFKGKLSCTDKSCLKTLREYKFYFSAENNLCDNYITEKYWHNPFQIDAIPITFGGSNYSNPQLAIPGSFINALDFKTPKHLVEYIKKVDSNDTLFNQYFLWKTKYKLRKEPHGCSQSMNTFCEKLHSGIKLRKNPLTSEINSQNECNKQEKYFNEWIKK